MSDNKATKHDATGNLHTPKCRIAWNSLFTPKAMKGASPDTAKYDITLLIPKTANIDVLKAAAAEVAKEKFGDKVKGIRSPFRKTDEKDNLADIAEDFPYYITARSKDRPGIVGPNGKRVDDPEQVYAGRWAKASIQAFAYDNAGNKGASFGLQNVQLLDHDEPLAIGGSRVAAESEFEAVAGAGDDSKSSDSVFE